MDINLLSSELVLVFVAGGCCLVGVVIWLATSWLGLRKSAQKIMNNEDLRKRGMTAPAVIVSARKGLAQNTRMRIDFIVDVQPEGKPSFRQSFQHWTERRGYSAVMNELTGEAGRKIWVTYDPNNPNEMIFEYYEEDHQKMLEKQELDARRLEFNKLTEGNEELKKRGQPAEAVITRVEDLELPYPAKKSRAMRIEFDVMPTTGAKFQSEGNFLIGDVAIEKYSVGKKVYVRFDPLNPKIAVLDSERNKSLK